MNITIYTLLVTFLLSWNANAQKPELYILSIGVETYQNPKLNLTYAADDALDLAAALQKQTGLYDVVEVKTLTDAQATRANVRAALDGFRTSVTSNDLFIFIFSGHGIADYLVPFDFDITDPFGSALGKNDLKQKLANLGCNYIVMLDACHSGSFAKQVSGIKDVEMDAFRLNEEQASHDLLRELSNTDKMSFVIGSSSSDQISFECPACGHGYFAQTILDCLAGNEAKDLVRNRTYRPDADGNGFIGFNEFDNYIKEAVRVRTAAQSQPQKVYSMRQSGSDVPLFRPENAPALVVDNVPVIKDTDGDGITDTYDKCPTERGSFANNGCPMPVQSDKDNDGLVDEVDKCPFDKGPVANGGCPVGGSNVPFEKETINGVSFVMKQVRGGAFDMGCTAEQESDCQGDEKPRHSVLINTFYIGETEVTQELWYAVMGSDPLKLAFPNCPTCPVEMVNWDDVQAFLAKLNQRYPNKNYRLPTEAEWEYAARGGGLGKNYKYAGSDDIGSVAWYSENSNRKTHPVKGKAPNELGLYDMIGNAWEWCNDWYDANSYQNGSSNNPKGPLNGAFRVVRGGSWNRNAQGSRVSRRDIGTPSDRLSDLGFRIVRDL